MEWRLARHWSAGTNDDSARCKTETAKRTLRLLEGSPSHCLIISIHFSKVNVKVPSDGSVAVLESTVDDLDHVQSQCRRLIQFQMVPVT